MAIPNVRSATLNLAPIIATPGHCRANSQPFPRHFRLRSSTPLRPILNGGAAWTDVTKNLPLDPTKTQGSPIAPNPNNVNDAYLGVSGFTSVTGIGHVFRTTDFGASWARSDGAGGAASLPDVPVIKMLVDRRDVSGNTILAGTDIGVFNSTDGGGTCNFFIIWEELCPMCRSSIWHKTITV